MTTYPIVLAHGIARFDVFRQNLQDSILLGPFARLDQFHYFRNIRTHLEGHGFTVFSSDVAFAADVEVRATQLARNIEKILEKGHSKVHIIAHSMGGLDARHMLVHIPGMDQKVASLTTIGTPHNGTSFAEWGISHGGDKIIEAISPVLPLEGFADLTMASCEAFNKKAMAAEAANPVVYQTYSASEEKKYVLTVLQASWQIIHDAEVAAERPPENDGLVPVTSQAWRTELVSEGHPPKKIRQHKFPVSADHLNEVGWWDLHQPGGILGRDEYEGRIKAVYLEIAQGVAQIR